mmetsp:Transcript_35136/g.74953  ORF Transcript_35136/g.74953 Transcript_35136/m.74953 type:complete len:208 (-) Transcript_35136:67-690(-)
MARRSVPNWAHPKAPRSAPRKARGTASRSDPNWARPTAPRSDPERARRREMQRWRATRWVCSWSWGPPPLWLPSPPWMPRTSSAPSSPVLMSPSPPLPSPFLPFRLLRCRPPWRTARDRQARARGCGAACTPQCPAISSPASPSNLPRSPADVGRILPRSCRLSSPEGPAASPRPPPSPPRGSPTRRRSNRPRAARSPSRRSPVLIV